MTRIDGFLHCLTLVVITVCLCLLAGCSSGAVQERPVIVTQPVPQPCVEGTRPPLVEPLREKVPDAVWATLDVRQKAAYVGKQGLERQAYGEQLNAATGACP